MKRPIRAILAGSFAFVAAIGTAISSPALTTTTIEVETRSGTKVFSVEVASDPQSQQRGLMYRRHMRPNAGMLFDFHAPAMISFWMKNTLMPLDILFVREDGTISTIVPNAVPYSTALIPSAEPVRAVLEINGGRAHALGIHAGDQVRASIFHNTR